MFSGGIFVMAAAILRCVLILTVRFSLKARRSSPANILSLISRQASTAPNKQAAGLSVKPSSPSSSAIFPWFTRSSPHSSGKSPRASPPIVQLVQVMGRRSKTSYGRYGKSRRVLTHWVSRAVRNVSSRIGIGSMQTPLIDRLSKRRGVAIVAVVVGFTLQIRWRSIMNLLRCQPEGMDWKGSRIVIFRLRGVEYCGFPVRTYRNIEPACMHACVPFMFNVNIYLHACFHLLFLQYRS